jgi:hypothetical protein
MHKEFEVHLLNEQGIEKANQLAKIFDLALTGIEVLAGTGGREMSIVRTKLEEASFFAKKAMAILPENQR